jgi:tRNA A37 methylthiotransferase MiaB
MEGMLVENGFTIADDPEKADVIVINTCIVKTPTENRIRDRIKFLVKKYPSKKLVIAGCAADLGLFKDVSRNAKFISSHSPDRGDNGNRVWMSR